jgi:hypothetical protein
MNWPPSIFLIWLCVACSSIPSTEPSDLQNGATEVDSHSIVTTSPEEAGQDSAIQETSFLIQDSTQYSTTFLAAFREKNAWIGRHIELRGDLMIVEGDPLKDAIILPTDLPLNRKVRYTKEHQDKRYRLELTRINISTVAYRYTVNDGRTALLNHEGTADLDPRFFYGAEGDFEDDGQTYGMNKYHPNDTTCEDYLLIGHGSIAMASYIRRCGASKDTVLSMGMLKQ